MLPTAESVHNRMRDLGYVVFNKQHDMNVVGLRRIKGTASKFDDIMTLSYRDGDIVKLYSWPCTTDPGGKYLVKPLGRLGTAILKPGQYRGSHRLGVFGGSKAWAHEALMHVGKLTLWHDDNRDTTVDYGLAETVSEGTAGICIHRNLGDFSAGCQVFERNADFSQFIALCKLQVAAGLGDKFTYTLLDWEL